MTEMAPNRRALRGIHIARGFLGLQPLRVDQASRQEGQWADGIDCRTAAAAPEEHADQPEAEIRSLYERVVVTLAELGNALVVPILVSAPHASEDYLAVLEEHVDNEIAVERTGMGMRTPLTTGRQNATGSMAGGRRRYRTGFSYSALSQSGMTLPWKQECPWVRTGVVAKIAPMDSPAISRSKLYYHLITKYRQWRRSLT